MARTPTGKPKAPPMIVGTAKHGNVTLAVLPRAIPSLRLLSWHAPDFRVECTDKSGATLMLRLSELDITHVTIDRLNSGRPSFVEAVTDGTPLAALGK